MYNRVSNTPCRRLRAGLCAILLVTSPLVLAETLEQRLHRLEAEIQEIRSTLSQKQTPPSPTQDTPAEKPATRPTETNSPAPQLLQSSAYIRYYIQSQPLKSPSGAAPLASGRFSSPAELSFDPAAYDVENSGMFSAYRDTSEYPHAGIEMQANLNIPEAGEYEFVVYPQPSRDGGTRVSTYLSLSYSIDGRDIISFKHDNSWRPRRSRLSLSPGLHTLHLWAVASSDGFGPTPTDSRIRLALKGPRDVSPRPLYGLQAPVTPTD